MTPSRRKSVFRGHPSQPWLATQKAALKNRPVPKMGDRDPSIALRWEARLRRMLA